MNLFFWRKKPTLPDISSLGLSAEETRDRLKAWEVAALKQRLRLHEEMRHKSEPSMETPPLGDKLCLAPYSESHHAPQEVETELTRVRQELAQARAEIARIEPTELEKQNEALVIMNQDLQGECNALRNLFLSAMEESMETSLRWEYIHRSFTVHSKEMRR